MAHLDKCKSGNGLNTGFELQLSKSSAEIWIVYVEPVSNGSIIFVKVVFLQHLWYANIYPLGSWLSGILIL